jgi:hypothetical protein
MSLKRLHLRALGILFLACAIPVGLTAQATDTDKKISDLEKQLDAIRVQIEALKTATPATPATAPAIPAAAAVVTPAPAPAPNPMAGITSVLGGVNLTGLVDAYYGYNANHPALTYQGVPTGTNTEPFSFTNNQFSLNLLELQLEKPVDKATPLGFRVAFGFGQAMNAVNNVGNSPNSPDVASGLAGVDQYLKEGYLSYFAPLGKGLQIDAGKFVTPAGAEVIETNQNWNYSRSLLFSYAIPYYHMGVRAKYTFNDKVSVTAYATNGWNNVVATNTGKTGGLSVAWNATKKLSITETYLGGPRDYYGVGNNGPWNNLTDTVIAYNLTPKLTLQANLDYNRIEEFGASKKPADYAGIAGYVKYALSPVVAVAARYEYLNDHDGLATPISYYGIAKGQHMNEFTGTVERKIAGHLLSRLEYRHDSSNQPFFARGNTIGAVKGQSTVDAGLVFVLEPGETK